MLIAVAFLLLCAISVDGEPLACQPNDEQPMLPIYHIIGNVTKNPDGSIKLEAINDCSGVTYYEGLWHVWHQCCQNHWDHAISKDLIHWQRLPAPIQPLKLRTFDGSISMLPAKDGGPVILYDAQDGKLGDPMDKPILGVARLADPNDKYLMKWKRDEHNPVSFIGKGTAFPGQIWKNGEHWNFIAKGFRFTSNDSTFHTWTRMNEIIGIGEHGGQWWVPVPNQADGSPPPVGVPNYLVNVGGGDLLLFGNYYPSNETFVPWAPNGEKPGKEAHLEGGHADWWGTQMANDRLMTIGWAMGDFHGPAGPGIDFLTRLTLLREVHYDSKIENLVSNPVKELVGLRNGTLASQKNVTLQVNTHHVVPGTGAGAAASADVMITFFGITGDSVFGACVLGSQGLGVSIKVSPGKDANVALGACADGNVLLSSLGSSGTIQLFDETEVSVRITADRSLADFFVQGGRFSGTMTWPGKTPRAAAESEVAVWASTTGVMADVDVYSMGCGWTDPSYTEHPSMFFEDVVV